jgi:TfoX/Sxy family transcriptional regulator of competence genes
MGTQGATMEHLLDLLQAAGPLRAKRMFGEYALYLDDRVVAFVCDDSLFLKNLPEVRALLPEAPLAPAYPGSKDYILAAEVLDEPERVVAALRMTARLLPAPKPKPAKRPKA